MALRDGKKLDIDSEAIRELAALMEETGLTEIEVAEGDRRVRVAKTASVAALPAVAAALPPYPSAPPFIKAGDTVNVGDTLLIIEAMKVMNPIKAAKAGRVTRIVVADAQPVEFGEVLLIVE